MIAGKARTIGLGPVHNVSLAKARNKADMAHKLIAGSDQLAERDAACVATIATEARATTCHGGRTLHRCAGSRAEEHEAPRAVAQHTRHLRGASDWRRSRRCLQILEPIWQIKPELATRLRGRLEMVLLYAIVRGWRDGPNPAV